MAPGTPRRLVDSTGRRRERPPNTLILGGRPSPLLRFICFSPGCKSLEAKCQAVCFALLLMDSMSEPAARYAVHRHWVAKLDSFYDHAGFLPAIRAAALERMRPGSFAHRG